jgi:hypothetical protein
MWNSAISRRRRPVFLSTIVLTATILFVSAPSVFAASVTTCQNSSYVSLHDGEPAGFRSGVHVHQGIRADWSAQDVAHPPVQICLDPGNSDSVSAASDWIALEADTSPGLANILQIGTIRCGGGCDQISNSNYAGVPNDGSVYIWYSWGQDCLIPPGLACGGPDGTGPEPVKIAAWNGTQAVRAVIYRQCGLNQFGQTECNPALQDSGQFNFYVLAATQNGADPVTNAQYTVTVKEDDVPWLRDASAQSPARGHVDCETWDAGDQCGGVDYGGLVYALNAVLVKDSSSGPGGTWASPKFTKPQCDYVQLTPFTTCIVGQSGGGSGTGSVTLETKNNR